MAEPTPLEAVYDDGRRRRRESEDYRNPYERGTPEQRKFYEGWCWQNFLVWRRKEAWRWLS